MALRSKKEAKEKKAEDLKVEVETLRSKKDKWPYWSKKLSHLRLPTLRVKVA